MSSKIEIQPWLITALCLLGLFVMVACLIRPSKVVYTTAETPPDETKVEIDLPLPKQPADSAINITYGDWWHRPVIILNGHNTPDTIEKLVAGEPIRHWNGYLHWEGDSMPHSVGSTELSEYKTDHGKSLDMHSFHLSSIEVCYLSSTGHMIHWSSPLVPEKAKG